MSKARTWREAERLRGVGPGGGLASLQLHPQPAGGPRRALPPEGEPAHPVAGHDPPVSAAAAASVQDLRGGTGTLSLSV